MDVVLNQQEPGQERYPPPQRMPDGLDIHGLLRLFWRHKTLIVLTIVAFLAAAGSYAFLATPRYEATAQLLFEADSGFSAEDAAAQRSEPQDEASVLSQVSVLQSRDLAERVIDKLQLHTVEELNPKAESGRGIFSLLKSSLPWMFTKEDGHAQAQGEDALQDSLRWPPLGSAADKDPEQAQVVNSFLRRLEVTPVGRSRAVEITFTAQDPVLAAAVANSIAEMYLVTRFEQRLQHAQQTSDWLSTHAQQIKADVEQTEGTLEAYRREHDLLQGERMMLLTQQLTDVNRDLNQASNDLAVAEAELAQARLVGKTGDISALSRVLDSGLIQKLREEEVRLERLEAEMDERYGPLYPQVKEFQAAKQNFQEKTRNEVNKIIRSLESRAEVARLRRDDLSQALESLKEQVGQANAKSIRLRTLEKDAETSRLLLDKFMTSFMEMNAQQDVQAQVPQASIISRAPVPDRPSFPNKTLILLMGLIGGTVLSAPLAFAVDALGYGYRSAQDIELDTGVPVLAHVPEVTGNKAGNGNLVSYISRKPNSVFTEAVRLLCTRLLVSSWYRPHQSFVFISSQAGEGKTTLVLSAARILARSGRKVLVVDADFRCGKVARIIGLHQEPGLSELMAGAVPLEDVIQRDGELAVDVIVNGAYASDSADDLAGETFADLLQELRSRYDVVLIDAPPFLAMASPSVLASKADAVVVIAAWGTTRREVLRYTLEQLRGLSPRVAGVVLNKVNLKKNGQYDYGDSTIFGTQSHKYYVS